MLVKIAWRNVWRSKLRSLVVIIAVILGIWAGLFINALNNGFVIQRTETLISNTLSHIQIHNTAFVTDKNIEFFIPSVEAVADVLKQDDNIIAYSERTIITGMVSSAAGGYGIQIVGIDPELERSVTIIHQKVVDGKYFEGGRKNAVVIGVRLAKKLKAKIRSKIVLTFQDSEGDIVAGAFRVVGIFETVSSKYDEMHVFVRGEDIQRLLGGDKPIHEIAILADNLEHVDEVKQRLKQQCPDLTIRSWNEISPELGYTNDLMEQYMYIFIGIILLALTFGIINTMLMAVLERKRELGMLMSVGMNKMRIFFMIVLETIFLSFIGGILGILLGYITIDYFHRHGIDLSIIDKGLKSFGYSTTVNPELNHEFYFNIAVMVVVAAILSAIYPAIKALKLKPAEAVRAL